MAEDIRFVGEMARLERKPGDVLVVTCEQIISTETAGRISDQVKAQLGEDVKVLVLTGGLKLGVMSAPAADGDAG